MKEFQDCNPVIVNRETLMTDDLDFINNELIKEKCNCVHKQVCFNLLRLLKENKREQAEDFLDKYKKPNWI